MAPRTGVWRSTRTRPASPVSASSALVLLDLAAPSPPIIERALDARDILDMVSRGETPPGIKDVNDKPLNIPIQARGSKEPPAKVFFD